MEGKKLIVEVTARMRVVAQVKGHVLLEPEVFKFSFDLMERDAKIFGDLVVTDESHRRAYNQIVTALAETETRARFVQVVIDRVRTDVWTKRRIGGTQWSVDVMDLSRSMPGDPLRLLVNKKNQKLKRICNGRLFAHECKVDVMKSSGVNASGFCQKCYFPGIEEKYKKYKEDRTNGLSSREAAQNNGFIPYPFVTKETA
jgi:hypothetical protein